MFDARIIRDKQGRLSVYMKSPALAEVIAAMGGASEGQASLYDPRTPSVSIEVPELPVAYRRVSGYDHYSNVCSVSGAVNMRIFCLPGLAEGMTLPISGTFAPATLANLGESIKTTVRTIFEMAQPVNISISIKPRNAYEPSVAPVVPATLEAF